MSNSLVLVERDARVALVTLNRPESRNALNASLIDQLRLVMSEIEADSGIDVVILTGADPAFCAGLDLKQLGSSAENLGVTGDGQGELSPHPWPQLTKPVIGAINGVAVTGGLEFVLNCDILIASERARFADTHARVGVLPGWGLSVLLPLVVGPGLARRMSLTGDFLSADEALRAGLVTEVVPHEELIPAARRIAAAIVSNNRDAVRALLDSYRKIEIEQVGRGFEVEAEAGQAWLERGFDPREVEARRQGILARGRAQTTYIEHL